MNEIEVIDRVRSLIKRKELITSNINIIENNIYPSVIEIVLKRPNFNEHRSVEAHNEKRLYSKVKYLILAELKESLDEVNAEIDSLIEFKGVDKS